MKCKFSVDETCVISNVPVLTKCEGKDKDKAACPLWSSSGKKFKVE